MIKEEKIDQYLMEEAFSLQVNPGLEVFPMFSQGWLVDSYPPGVVFRKTLNLYREFQLIRNFNVTQYFMTIVGQHFQ